MITMSHREQIFKLLQLKMFNIQAAKGRDYGEEQDGLKNLRRRGVRGVLGRMEDKMIRLDNLTQPGREVLVKDESVEDTLIDLANYCLLLIILMWDEQNKLPTMFVDAFGTGAIYIRKIDEKHDIRIEPTPEGSLAARIYKSTNDTPIQDEEPVILFRGRDRLALPMLRYYMNQCKEDGATPYQLQSMNVMVRRFEEFALAYPETMKQPGSTSGR